MLVTAANRRQNHLMRLSLTTQKISKSMVHTLPSWQYSLPVRFNNILTKQFLKELTSVRSLYFIFHFFLFFFIIFNTYEKTVYDLKSFELILFFFNKGNMFIVFVLKRFAVLWASFRIHKWIKKTAEKKGIVFIYRHLMKKLFKQVRG